MKAKPPGIRNRKKDGFSDNPIHDSFAQELGYKLDERVVGCFAIVGPVILLLLAIVAFLIYWKWQ